MKVVLTGAHGSGKTSTSVRLAQELGMIHVEEGAREVFDKYNLKEDLGTMPVEMAIRVQDEILNNHHFKAGEFSSFISDRGVMDVLAYSHFWLSRRPEANDLFTRTKQVVAQFSNYYSLVILVPPKIPLVDDGTRSPLYFYRETIHYLILGILRDFGYRYEILHTQKMEDRVEECKGLIQLYNARNRVW